MRLKIHFDLDKLTHTQLTMEIDITFENITNRENFEGDANVTQLRYEGANDRMYVFLNGSSLPSYDVEGYDIQDISDDESYIAFECDVDNSDLSELLYLVSNNIISLDLNGRNALMCFRLNDERDRLNKNITYVTTIYGNYKAPLSVKNLEIDVTNYPSENIYNYIYIPKLKRFYYVTNVAFINKDFTRLQLQEDVLMSWKNLIKSQNAFITRQQSGSNALVDNRLPLADKLSIMKLYVTDTTVNSYVNITLNFDNSGVDMKPNVLISSICNSIPERLGSEKTVAPSGSDLPNISSVISPNQWLNFIKPLKLTAFMNAVYSDDNVSSYINSVIWLPFDPTTVFDLVTDSHRAIYVRDKYIDEDGHYVSFTSTNLPLETYQITTGKGTTPYLIIKDFTYNPPSDSFVYREPYSNYEFYIPFVGWVKVNSEDFFGSRIIIYYTIDTITGISTAYIYNNISKRVIWSGSCQLGIKIDLTTSNQYENIKQKQSNDLNMLLGLIGSAVAVGVGAYTGNGVAVAGGLLSASKTIASTVNSNNMLYERAQTSFGSPNGSLHSPLEFAIRRVYHETISQNESVYNSLQGKPLNVYGSLSSYVGYTEIGDIHFDAKGEDIYNVEIDEIVALLKNGVIL